VIVKDPETGEESRSNAVLAGKFDLLVDRSSLLTDSSVQTIWADETQCFMYETVIFEKQFEVEMDLVEAHLDFVAPISAQILLNGKPLGKPYEISSDAQPSYHANPIQVDLPTTSLRRGKNTLRIEVYNTSLDRGMMAQISFTQFSQE